MFGLPVNGVNGLIGVIEDDAAAAANRLNVNSDAFYLGLVEDAIHSADRAEAALDELKGLKAATDKVLKTHADHTMLRLECLCQGIKSTLHSEIDLSVARSLLGSGDQTSPSPSDQEPSQMDDPLLFQCLRSPVPSPVGSPKVPEAGPVTAPVHKMVGHEEADEAAGPSTVAAIPAAQQTEEVSAPVSSPEMPAVNSSPESQETNPKKNKMLRRSRSSVTLEMREKISSKVDSIVSPSSKTISYLKQTAEAVSKVDFSPKDVKVNPLDSKVHARQILYVKNSFNESVRKEIAMGKSAIGQASQYFFMGQKQADEVWTTIRESTVGHYYTSLSEKMLVFVNDVRFALFFGVLILVNALCFVVGVDAEVDAARGGEGMSDATESILDSMQHFFVVAFLIEIILRMVAYGRQYFIGEDVGWNWFDLIIVASSCMETWSSNGVAGVNVAFLRCVRMFRLMRLCRLFRVVRWLHELRVLLAMILGCFGMLAWTVLFLFIFMMVGAILLTACLASHQTNDVDQEHLWVYFGSVMKSFFTLFQVLTLDSYSAVVRDVMDDVSVVWGLFFVAYVIFTTFVVMNTVTGCFVQSAIQTTNQDNELIVAQQQKDKSEMAEILTGILRAADVDDSGTITREEFEAHIDQQHVVDLLSALGLEIEASKGIFALMDMKQKGEVDIDELVVSLLHARGEASNLDLLTGIYEFQRVASRINDIESSMTAASSDFAWKLDALHERHAAHERQYQCFTARAGNATDTNEQPVGPVGPV